MTDNLVLLVHSSPSGRIHINHVGERDPFDPFEVSADVAESLLMQYDVFRPAVTEFDDIAVGALRKELENRGLSAEGEKDLLISRLWGSDRAAEWLAAAADAEEAEEPEPVVEEPPAEVVPESVEQDEQNGGVR